jgi:Fe-S oxidoreductase
MDALLGIDRRRPLPAFARETFPDWFDRRRAPAADAPRGSVVLFHDTFVTYNAPEIGRAAVELLEAAGYKVELVDRKCCGRPLISKGMLDEAREHARWNVSAGWRGARRRRGMLLPIDASRRVRAPSNRGRTDVARSAFS